MSGVFGGAVAKKWEFVATVYDFGVDGVLVSVETPDFEDGFEYKVVCEDISHNSGSNSYFRVELYKETDAAYHVALQGICEFGGQTILVSGVIYLSDARISQTIHLVEAYGQINGDTGSGKAWGGTFEMAAQKIGKLRFTNDSGSYDGGTIKLYKRAL